jgi:hypothetical protein
MAMRKTQLEAAVSADRRDVARFSTPIPRKQRMRVRGFRISDEDWSILTAYFARKGLGSAAGLRMVIMDYMEKEGLR